MRNLTLFGLSEQRLQRHALYETACSAPASRSAIAARFSRREQRAPATMSKAIIRRLNIDASIRYSVTDNIELSLEGINLTDEYRDQYHRYRRQPAQLQNNHIGRQSCSGPLPALTATFRPGKCPAAFVGAAWTADEHQAARLAASPLAGLSPDRAAPLLAQGSRGVELARSLCRDAMGHGASRASAAPISATAPSSTRSSPATVPIRPSCATARIITSPSRASTPIPASSSGTAATW